MTTSSARLIKLKVLFNFVTVENGKVCGINEIFCIKDAQYSLLTLQPPWVTNTTLMKCPCLPGCEDIQINAIMSRDYGSLK